jgi:DNA-directed RNA polymerase specialized sigma24 family protein
MARRQCFPAKTQQEATMRAGRDGSLGAAGAGRASPGEAGDAAAEGHGPAAGGRGAAAAVPGPQPGPSRSSGRRPRLGGTCALPPEGGGSVTHWLGQLRSGDPAAAGPLWERYFRRLVELARQRLRGRPPRAADEEDVALSAFASFCRGAREGRFPRLDDRDGLWRLLVVLTARKAAHLVRDEGRHKRGGASAPAAGEDAVLGQVVGREPTPEFAAQVADECRRLLGRLGDPRLVAVAVCKMEGYTHAEVCDRLGCAPRTLDRKLQLIRSVWQEELGP